jgi:hypothetical protein
MQRYFSEDLLAQAWFVIKIETYNYAADLQVFIFDWFAGYSLVC